MKGYLKNENDKFYFAIQRNIAPGMEVSFDDVYLSLGKRSGLKNTQAFLDWVNQNILASKGSWGFYKENGTAIKMKPVNREMASAKPARGAGRALRRTSPEVGKGVTITPSMIVEADYERAKIMIDATSSRAILRRALNLSQHFSNKGYHMRHLMKRLDQV